MSATRIAPAIGAREIVADDCSELIYANGMYHFDLMMSSPVSENGPTEIRVSGHIMLSPKGLWRFQNKILNVKRSKRLDG